MNTLLKAIVALLATTHCVSAAGESISANIGTLPPGKTINVIYTTTADNIPLGTSTISNQGTITTSFGTSHISGDPGQSGPSDPEDATTTPASNTYQAPGNLIFLEDPAASEASSSTSNGDGMGGVYPVSNLYDGNPNPADIDDTFNFFGAWGGDGLGPHIVIYEYSERVVFNSLAYAQRSSFSDFDRVPSLKLWVSETDPRGGLSGTGLFGMPILSTPPAAETDLITTDTQILLRHYPLGEHMAARYVIFELAPGPNFNPGGAELALTLSAPPPVEGLSLRRYSGGLAFIFSSDSGIDYDIERSFDLINWGSFLQDVPGRAGATSIHDLSAPATEDFLFYRATELTPP